MDKELENIDQQKPRHFTGSAKLLIATTVTAVLIASIIGGTRRLKAYNKLRHDRQYINDYLTSYKWDLHAKHLLAAKGSHTLDDLGLDPSFRSRLLIAVLNDHYMDEREKCDALRRLLKEGADPNYTDTRATPVIFHARSRFAVNVTLLNVLLKEGHANPDVQNANGDTLLAAGGLFRTKALLVAGANPNIADKFGQTPIFNQTYPKVVELLLEYGADPTIRCTDGYTALELIEAWNTPEPTVQLTKVCELLKDAEREWLEKKGAGSPEQ